MAGGDVETFHEGGAWYNRVDGEHGATGPYKTKADAIDAGRHQARRARREHVIRDEDGLVDERIAFGDETS
ncbi:DUF2188 domain-containing protein [Herbiconiux sp. P17]|uniref:DUF2188 domain-containing protein n=1 Tax=Herbiconiux wuyangfengii TaxID=3342794 RepID=UPI0035B74F85